MPEGIAIKKRRQRHFWNMVKTSKKIPRDSARKDVRALNKLRAEHSKRIYLKSKIVSSSPCSPAHLICLNVS